MTAYEVDSEKGQNGKSVNLSILVLCIVARDERRPLNYAKSSQLVVAMKGPISRPIGEISENSEMGMVKLSNVKSCP